jgi:hypothetical protein
MRDEFIIMRQGRRYVLYAGLLDEASNKGLAGIETELIQVPTAENGNVAICKANVGIFLTKKEQEEYGGRAVKSFQGIGDASPENVGSGIKPHIIRMSETRAKARALRDAINVGETALEELGDEEQPATQKTSRGAQDPRRKPASPSGEPADDEREGLLSLRQVKYLKYLIEDTGHSVANVEQVHGPIDEMRWQVGKEQIDHYKAIKDQAKAGG